MKINETENLEEVSRLKKEIYDLNTKITKLENQNEVLLNTVAAIKIAIKRQEADLEFASKKMSSVQKIESDEVSDEEIDNFPF